MSKRTLHINDIDACEYCDHCFEKRHPWYYCSLGNDNFGDISDLDECDESVPSDDDDDDFGDDDDFDPTEPISCEKCGADAFWNGSCYQCDECGWCGIPDDDE